nr:uncharacterized protein LOC125979319 [Syngnathus scovelli]XP_049595258.1 uncharacterized protein LOC125980185 [Syngnathus scovelli]
MKRRAGGRRPPDPRLVSGVQRKQSPKESSRQVLKRRLMHDWPRLARGLPGRPTGRAPACTERDWAAPTRPGRGQAEDESNTGRSRPGPWPVTSGPHETDGCRCSQRFGGRLLGAVDQTSACTERDWTGPRDQRWHEAEDESKRRIPAGGGANHRPTFARDERPTRGGWVRMRRGQSAQPAFKESMTVFPFVLSFFPSLHFFTGCAHWPSA